MNLIIDDIEAFVKQRVKIDFNTDFRICILFEMLMQDTKIKDNVKVYQALNLFYPDTRQIIDVKKAVDDILWFYAGGKENTTSQRNTGKEESKKKQIYSYEFDDGLIYSAFKDQYNIDLQDIEYLHWWKFKALFNGLKKDNEIVKAMEYRALDLSTIKDKEERKHYKKLKKLYALPDMRTEEEKEADFGKSFW